MPRKPKASAPEDRIIEGARQGNPRDFEALVEFYGGRLNAFIKKNYPTLFYADAAVDCIQETWLKAYKPMLKVYVGPGKLGPDNGSFGTWIHAILIKACLNRLPRKKRKGIPQEDPEEQESSEAVSKDDGGDENTPRVVGKDHPSEAGGAWWEGLAADAEEEEERQERETKAEAIRKHIQEKGLKETKLAIMSFVPNWRDVVIDDLSTEYPQDTRRLFEARRILRHSKTERGIREWTHAAGEGKHQVTWRKTSLMIDICAESAIRHRLPRKDPERCSPGDLACALSYSFTCGVFRVPGGEPLYSACAAFLNATFPAGKRWTATRIRQTVSRLGWASGGIIRGVSEVSKK